MRRWADELVSNDLTACSNRQKHCTVIVAGHLGRNRYWAEYLVSGRCRRKTSGLITDTARSNSMLPQLLLLIVLQHEIAFNSNFDTRPSQGGQVQRFQYNLFGRQNLAGACPSFLTRSSGWQLPYHLSSSCCLWLCCSIRSSR